MNWSQVGYVSEPINDQYIKLTHVLCSHSFTRHKSSILNPELCDYCFETKSVSQDKVALREWISSIIDHEIIYQDKSILKNGFEIDILIPRLKLGIEYNGLYWHSEEIGKSKWYHSTKHNKCAEQGIRLIQIFEDEWLYKQNIVKTRLRHILKLNQQPSKISARKCIVESIQSSVAKLFYEKYHIQGRGTGTVAYALIYQNDIVAVMDFAPLSRAKGQRAKDGNWELTRFSVNGHIPGAAGKLFSAFIKSHDPESIISYSDCRWNTGTVYERLGFIKQGTTTPNYWYIEGNKRHHRYKYRKDQLIKEGFDFNKTEREIMQERGFKRIWDCGHDKWIWSRK